MLSKIVKRAQLIERTQNYENKAKELVEKIEQADTQLVPVLTQLSEAAETVANDVKNIYDTLSELVDFVAGSDRLDAENFILMTRETQLRFLEQTSAAVTNILRKLSLMYGGATGVELAVKYAQTRSASAANDPLEKLLDKEVKLLLADLYTLLKHKFEHFKGELIIDPKKLRENLPFELVDKYMQNLIILKETVDYALRVMDEAARFNMNIDEYKELYDNLKKLQEQLEDLKILEQEYKMLKDKGYGELDVYNMLAKTVRELMIIKEILDTAKKLLEKAPSFKRGYETGEIPKEILHENLYVALMVPFKQLATVLILISDYLNRIKAAQVSDEEAFKIYMNEFERILEKRIKDRLRAKIYARMLGEERAINSFEEFEKLLEKKLERLNEDLKNLRKLSKKLENSDQ